MTEAAKEGCKATRRGVEWTITVRFQEEAWESDATYWRRRRRLHLECTQNTRLP